MADLNYIDRDLEVKIVGQDATGNSLNFVSADVNGNLFVKDYSNGPVSPGTVASTSSLIGGQYNSTLPTLTNTQQSSIQVDSSGRLLVNASGSSVGIADESAFTYGTTVQQVVGGVYQDTSPTLTSGQQGAIRLTQNRAQHANLRNSSGTEITSSSNGNAGNQLIHVQTPDTTTASTALGVLNATVSIVIAGLSSVGFQLAAGTLIGTITPQSSLDGGTTWGQASFYNPSNSSVVNSITFSSSNTLQILSILPIGGSSNVRVIVTAYTSGTANSLLRASKVIGTAGAVISAAFGTVTNSSVSIPGNIATLLLSSNPNRKYAYISNVGGSTINIQFGSSAGLSTTVGLIIPSKTFYELKGDNLYTGSIFGYCAGNETVSITEGTP